MLKQTTVRADCDTERRRLKRARALLEMFEEDCGRRAATVEELREWMGMQYTDQLQIRMNRRLHGIDAGASAYRARSHPILAQL
jgi:CHAD domain-containing protein